MLLLFGVTLLTVLVLAQFHFSPGELYAAVAARYGQAALEPGGLVSDPIDAVSLGPGADVRPARAAAHPDAVLHRARRPRGPRVGALRHRLHRLLLPDHSDRRLRRVGARRPRDHPVRSTPGGNMAAPLVAELLGGTPFLGFIAAVAFATILAVVAGLDARRRERAVARHLHARDPQGARDRSTSRSASRASRPSPSASSRSCSASCSRGRTSRSWSAWRLPWRQRELSRRCCCRSCGAGSTRRARCASIVTGALLSVMLIVLSPTIWVDLLHNAGRDLPAAQPGDRLDAAELSRRHRRLAAHARARGRSEVRRREAADVSRDGRRVVPAAGRRRTPLSGAGRHSGARPPRRSTCD